jgi:uncharacterized membrane protein YphA (DoxX/SURF4 family)
MLQGRFAQVMEALAIFCILFGIFSLCQPWSFSLYRNGFHFLVAGWVGLIIWSHRKPIRPVIEESNPQITIDGHPPAEVTLGKRG